MESRYDLKISSRSESFYQTDFHHLSCLPSDGQGGSDTAQPQFDGGHTQLPQHSQASGNTGEGTFRHPLPPSIVRPRMPIQPNILIRNPIGTVFLWQ